MLAIADIFEALTAADRPYKPAKKLSETLKIMTDMKNNGHIDPNLFELFIESKIYLTFAIKYLNSDQIDV
jgi:HD-GYP domain-containing protein (c-di-GMP phosphodiesterase class II)